MPSTKNPKKSPAPDMANESDNIPGTDEKDPGLPSSERDGGNARGGQEGTPDAKPAERERGAGEEGARR
jgi:hypothetical protein